MSNILGDGIFESKIGSIQSEESFLSKYGIYILLGVIALALYYKYKYLPDKQKSAYDVQPYREETYRPV